MVVVVRDEEVLGATNTSIAEQGARREATEDLDNDILMLEASSISSACSRMRACSVMRSLKRKIIQQRSNSEVHNSYQSPTMKLMEL
jgi:hypothetical protein